MEGIDKITARISADARREAGEVLEKARAQGAEIAGTYAAQGAQEKTEALERGRREAAERVERLARVAALEGRKEELAAKQALLDRAFALALEKLASLPPEEYVPWLASLAARGARSGREALIFSQADRARYGKAVVMAANARLEQEGRPAQLTLSQETRPMAGGFILAEDRVETNCTLETLVRLQREAATREVAELLFRP